MTTRRQFATQLGTLAALVAAGMRHAAHGQQAEIARVLVGFPPGGSTDNVARRLTDKLRGTYASNVIVENRPGAGAQIAVTATKEAAPDGTTLLLSPPAPFTVYPHTYRKLPYALEDVQPVSMVCTFPFAFAVGPAVPESIRNITDFVAWVKANPGRGAFGSPASGSTPHLMGSLLGQLAGVELTHVGYRGDGPGLQDLMGGQVPGYSTVLGSYLPQMKSGRLRLLAVSGATRSAFAPDVATFREQGYALDMSEWFGVFVPARTPAATVQRAGDAVRAAVAQPDFVRGLAEFGMTAQGSSAQELSQRVHAENAEWRANVKRIGFTAES